MSRVSLPDMFRCYWVNKDPSGHLSADVTQRPLSELPEGDVLVRVTCSSLNYKDAMAAVGHPGVARVFPLVPGVDAAGVVVESGVYEFVEGDEVLVTGFDMGSSHWGGFAEYVRVPQEWLVPLPRGLSLGESMMLGTAGLTAALCVDVLQQHAVVPSTGPIVVTGASGGVGCMAVAILAKLGYRVAAVTGKTSAHDLLRTLGAQEILGREGVDDQSGKGLLSARWAGAVDTVGGNILSTVLRSTRHSGCVAACGMAGGTNLPVTVYPFILRAVTLAGVDAAWFSTSKRHELWRRLAGPWKPDHLTSIARDCTLDDLTPKILQMLDGQSLGRWVVRVSG
jgi:putative YhdH/YhfP family quinone oxidoreductase